MRLLRKIIHVYYSNCAHTQNFTIQPGQDYFADQAFKIREGNVSWEILSEWLKIKIFWIWKNRLQTISLIGVQGKKYICTPSCGKLFYGTVICFYTFVMLFLYYTFCVKVSHIFLLFSTPKVSNLKSLSKICSKTIPFGLWRHGKLNKMVSPFWGCNRNNPGPVTIQNFVFCISEFWRSVFFYFKKNLSLTLTKVLHLKVVVEEHNIAIIVFFYENVYIIPLLKRWNSLFIKIYTIYANTTFKRLRNKSVRCPASSTEPTNADPCALRCLRGQTAWERATDYFFYHVGSLKIFSTLCMIFKHEKSKIKYTLMYFIKLTVCRAGKR